MKTEHLLQKLPDLGSFFDDLLNQSTPDKPVWNQEAILENKPPAWSYIDGCMLIAVLEMYQSTKEEKYFELSKKMLNNNLSDSDNNFIIEKIWPIIKGQYDFYKLAITL